MGLLDHVNFLRQLYTGFHNGCAILCPYTQTVHKTFLSSTSLQDFLSVFLMAAVLTGVKWHLTVALVYISLMVTDAEHLFTCLVMCISSFGKCLFGVLCPFFNRVGFFCWWAVWVPDINTLWILGTQTTQMYGSFSHPTGCLLTLLIFCSAGQSFIVLHSPSCLFLLQDHPEINPHIYSQPIFGNNDKKTQRKGEVLQ